MFGSEFAKQFGLPGPPWENLDAYGGLFGPIAQQQPLPGNVQLGEDQLRAGPSAAQPPVAGTPGMQAPQGPPIVSGDFSPETFYNDPQTSYDNPFQAQAPGGNQGGGSMTAQALSPGPLGPQTAGLTSEFAKKG